MPSLSNPHNFVLDQLYRLARTLDNPHLRGQLVIFRGWHTQPGDIRRAKMCLLKDDGGCGEEWLVNPHFVLPF